MTTALALRPTQMEQIAAHLNAGKAITPAQAMLVYRISRLSSIIQRLRLKGMDIVTVPKVDEGGAQYGEYKLAPQIKMGSLVTVKPGHGYTLPRWVRKSKAAKVVGLLAGKDVAYVEFIRGTRYEVHAMNLKELSCVA